MPRGSIEGTESEGSNRFDDGVDTRNFFDDDSQKASRIAIGRRNRQNAATVRDDPNLEGTPNSLAIFGWRG
jgi:hypothetical protein